ncbi:MAG: FAD-dependent oxidoreductase [Thermodesulfobacteriota bacterium]|nr:FAD-dependent oxidoreductase [Thermodesulfobacteriota bacterium]
MTASDGSPKGVVGQIMHTGRYAYLKDSNVEGPPIGPSDFTSPVKRYGKCRELTRDEIQDLVHQHGNAARLIKDAGFDGIEIGAIAGYLIASFLSGWTNRRKDEYGGSLENRTRFLIEILDEVERQVGSDYPLLLRLNGTDLISGGNTEEDYLEIAGMVQEKVDYISITVGWHETPGSSITPDIEPGHWLYLAEMWKRAGIKPQLGMAYRLNRPELADKAIGDGIIDYWEMCRPMIADPFLPLKIKEGRLEDIVTCPACNSGCLSRIFSNTSISCMLNPRTGHEGDPGYRVKPAERKKKVIIAGGGPAGMEAAIIAAMRGHRVTLYEKSDKIGGQMRLGAKAPMLKDWRYILDYYRTQIKKLNVEIELGREVTVDVINKQGPDVVILATGVHLRRSIIPGINTPIVLDLFEVLDGKADVGHKAVVWGGKEKGVQTAEFLAASGKNVTLVMEDSMPGKDINIVNLLCHRKMLEELKVSQVSGVEVERITDKGILVAKEDEKKEIEADSIILATEMEANNELFENMKSATDVKEIYSIGDCVAPRKLFNAIHDAFHAAIKI